MNAKWLTMIGLAGLAAWGLAVQWHARGMACDDAYITFRYADNLAQGLGLRWNVDSPPCEGYSNLTWVLAVAALIGVGLDPVTAALLLSSACIVGFTLLLARAGAGSRLPLLTLVPALLLFANEELAVHASRGLETLGFALLAMGLLAAVARLCSEAPVAGRHGLLLATLATLLFLTRPDGVLISTALWLGAFFLVRRDPGRRRVLFVGVAGWLLAGALYAAWKLAYFGYLLPNPFYAKSGDGAFVGIAEMLAFVADYAWLLGGTLLAALLALLRGRTPAAARTAPVDTTALLAIAVAVPWLTYSAKVLHEIGFAHRFSWPLAPLLALGMARALAVAADRLPTAGRRLPTVLAASAVLATVVGSWPTLRSQWQRLQQPSATDPGTAAFLRVGQAIFDSGIAPQLTLFCANAGATPYAARAHHVDPAGLVDDGYCLRTPLEERQRYQAGLRFDVVLWNLFPASPGAESFDTDPRAVASHYLNRTWLANSAALDPGTNLGLAQKTVEQRKFDLFTHMYVLREFGTLVGELHLPGLSARLFLYVWKQSPHHDLLVRHLGSRVDIPVERIDYAADAR